MGAGDCTDMCRSLPKEHPEGDWSVILVADEQARNLL